MSLDYKSSGVDIDAGNQLVEFIKPLSARTRRPEVLQGVGGFAALFALDTTRYREPLLVSTTDGVGTKLKLAQAMGSYRGLGQDLVAMCVNDLLCTGAEPLFFLDYYATGKLELTQAQEVLGGLAEALAGIRCSLIGGETAEMPGLYARGDFDLAGFAVGVVEKSQLIDGRGIREGDIVLGLASSGPHSNGFSLARKILETRALDLESTYPGFNLSLGKILLEPTRIYVNPVLELKSQFSLLGLAHITGGGLVENIPRILPEGLGVRLRRSAWPRPKIFEFLQTQGGVASAEMDRVFNQGIGMTVITRADQAEPLARRFGELGYPGFVIGEVEATRQARVVIEE